jgi:hypothetical protein
MSEADAVRRAVREIAPDSEEWSDEQCAQFLESLADAEDELDDEEDGDDLDEDDEDEEDDLEEDGDAEDS